MSDPVYREIFIRGAEGMGLIRESDPLYTEPLEQADFEEADRLRQEYEAKEAKKDARFSHLVDLIMSHSKRPAGYSKEPRHHYLKHFGKGK